MKTVALLLSAVSSYSQQLAIDHGSIVAQGFPEGSRVQIYASTDFAVWTPRYEMAAADRLPISGTKAEFYRARLKPNPCSIAFASTVCTGRVFKASGTASGLVVNVGGLIVTHQEMGLTNGRPGLIYCEWEYPARLLPIGINVLTFDFLDANNNHIDTNVTVLILPGQPLTVDHPVNGSLVAGTTTAILGHVEALEGTVTCGNFSAPVQLDGTFSLRGLSVSETNVVMVASGTNTVTVSFGKSRISFSGNISGRTVSGNADPSTRIVIGEKSTTPDANGSWKMDLPMPPVRGMLPFSIQSTNGESATGVLTSQYDTTGYFATSHALAYHYTYENSNDPDSHVKEIKTSMNSQGDVTATFRREYYPSRYSCPGVCHAEYSGEHMILWLDNEEGPCNYIESRRYFAEFGLVDYSDETSRMWFYHDALQIQEVSSCGLHIGGNSGRTFRIALQVSLDSLMRDGSAGDESTGGGPATSVKVGYVGGFPVDSSGVIYLNVIEGQNYNITPTLTPMNQGWFIYGFDWREVPIMTL